MKAYHLGFMSHKEGNELKHLNNALIQGRENSDLRAKCGPPQRFQWPTEAIRKYVQI